MKRFLLALFLPLLLAACNYEYETDWRQKLTLYIDTPDGLVTASSTIAIIARFPKPMAMKFLPIASPGLRTEVTGEAIVAKLGDGYLFVLLGNRDVLARNVLHDLDQTEGLSVDETSQLIARTTTPLVVPRKLWPMMVTFDDVTDPASVRRVDPDDLAATFGPGYGLREVTVQATDDPVTEGRVEEVLGWFSDNTLSDLWGSLSGPQHDILTRGNWRKGFPK